MDAHVVSSRVHLVGEGRSSSFGHSSQPDVNMEGAVSGIAELSEGARPSILNLLPGESLQYPDCVTPRLGLVDETKAGVNERGDTANLEAIDDGSDEQSSPSEKSWISNVTRIGRSGGSCEQQVCMTVVTV